MAKVIPINPLVQNVASGQINQPVLRPPTGKRRGTTMIGQQVANQIRQGGSDAQTAENLVRDIRKFTRR